MDTLNERVTATLNTHQQSSAKITKQNSAAAAPVKMLGKQHNDMTARVSFLEDQLKMLRDEKREADELAHNFELQIIALRDDNENLKQVRGPTYAQDINQNPQYRNLNEKYELANDTIRDLHNKIDIDQQQFKKADDELCRKA